METTPTTYNQSQGNNSIFNIDDLDSFYVSTYLYPFLKTFCIICYSVTFVVGSIGNGLVIWIAGLKMKNVSAVWFLNLAVADFACCTFLPVRIMEWALYTMSHYLLPLCEISLFVLILSMCSSVYFLAVISLDRCVSVIWPMWTKVHRTPKLARIISGIIWVASLMLSTPVSATSFFYENFSDCAEKGYQQWMGFSDPFVNMLRNTRLVLMFALPFSIILISYGLIFFKLRKLTITRRSPQSYRIVIAVVVCFFVCWFPYYTWPFIYIGEDNIEMDNLIHEIFVCLAYFNSLHQPRPLCFLISKLQRQLYQVHPSQTGESLH
ncbi:C3a anaphylatoxin chemotactic receptor-like [Hyperolius riggenbachi]|uniref:C3a anaphylatoxin chemotactic receptor-like n=1 Tax=Hyperolius riggenbachi TaxID=752182 RepID=UPI0035A31E10